MNEIEITNKLKRDSNLCEAVRRAQEELPLLPSGFSDKLMKRMNNLEKNKQNQKRKVRMVAILSSVAAACVILMWVFLRPQTPKQPIASAPAKEMNVQAVARTEKDEKIPHQQAIRDCDSVRRTEKLEKKIMLAEHKENKPLAYSQKVDKPNLKKRDNHPRAHRPIGEATPMIAKEDNPPITETEKFNPDTLGNDIFESRQNILIAMRLLSECEDIIRQEKQEFRNGLIEATFNAVPPSDNAILVKDENGDLNVVETGKRTIIEL